MCKVTVLLPVYNGELYLAKSIDSILCQSFADFELLIIDDGSTDGSKQIVENYTDKRIVFHQNQSNQGLIATLNTGIRIAKGDYIVRMDADDTAHRNRLEKIVDAFDADADLVICTTWHDVLSSNESPLQRLALNSDEIKTYLLFRCIVSFAAYRRSYFIDNKIQYDFDYPHAEDYELWARLINKVKYNMIPQVLYHINKHQNQVSNVYQTIQKKSTGLIHKKTLAFLGIDASDAELLLHGRIAFLEYEYNAGFLQAAENWLLKLIDANKKANVINIIDFEKVIGKIWFEILTDFSSKKIYTYKDFRRSRLSNFDLVERKYYLKYFVKNALLRVGRANKIQL